MIRQFHDGMLARVQDNGETSAAFPVSNGVKHGCVLALNLVSLMFSAMLTDAFKELNGGMSMRYRYHPHPQEASCKNQGLKRHHQHLPACWSLRPQRYLRSGHATQCWRALWCLQHLWAHNMHHEDWSNAPTHTKEALRWTQYLHQCKKTQLSEQVHASWQYTFPHIFHRRRDQHQTCQGKSCHRQTPQECVGQKRHHHGDKDQGLQSCSAYHYALWLWFVDGLPTPCQEDQPLPQHQSEEPTWRKMARQDPRHRGAHPSQPSQYPYDPDEDPTSLSRPCSLYATPSAP